MTLFAITIQYVYLGLSNILLIVSSDKINLTDVEFQSQDDSTESIVLKLSERQSANITKYFYETETFDPPKFPFKILVRKQYCFC